MNASKMNSNNDQEENSKQQLDNQSENLKEQLETNTIENLDTLEKSNQLSPKSRFRSENMFSSLAMKVMNKSKSRMNLTKKLSMMRSNPSFVKAKNIDNINGITDVTVLEEKLEEAKIRIQDDKPLKWAIYDFNCLVHMKSREYEDVTSLKK